MSCYRLSLSSRIVHAGRLRRWLAGLSRREGYARRFESVLALGVHEAFVNAATHGKLGELEQPVFIMVECGGRGRGRFVDVWVRDFGEGFELDVRLAEACSEQGRSRLGGRGLLLISHYAEQLSVERLPDGCVVRMRYIPY